MTYDEQIRLLQSENPDDVKKALQDIKMLISKGEKISDALLVLMLKSKVEGVDNIALQHIINHKQQNVISKLRVPRHITGGDIFNHALYELWKYVRKHNFDTDKKDAVERFLYVVGKSYISKSYGGGDFNTDEFPELFEYMILPFVTEEKRAALRRLFDKLGAGCKEILTMRYFGGLKFKEVAKETDYTEESARVTSSRCLKKLKQWIAQDDDLAKYIRDLLN